MLDYANFGHDSDTIGTISGAIVGAFKGIEAFPAEWIQTVQKVNQPDQVELSKQLYDMVVEMIRETQGRIKVPKGLV